jgi:outer membrane protein assembly factor BamB
LPGAGAAAHDAWPSELCDEIEAEAAAGGRLIVHLGCRSADRTAALRSGDRGIVHGLDTDAHEVAKARAHLHSAGLYGRVSVDHYNGKRLPYADNLVNLLVAEVPAQVPMGEVMRVLAPLGTAYVKAGGEWTKRTKPWPADIDEWTHFLHGPDNNAVARDRVVGPPSRLQWIADPIHLRSHEHLNGISALVSAHGRIFYIIDEGATASVVAPPQWRLVARDAFNGIRLWSRDIGPWEGHFRLFRSGPPAIARRLVAVGQRVYVTVGYGKCVAALDAATGRTLRTYHATKGALEIVCADGKLFVVVGEIDRTPPADPGKRYYPPSPPREKGIVALHAATGEVLWQRRDDDTAELMPTALAVDQGRVVLQNTRQVICLDAATGQEKWRADRPVYTKRLSWSAPTLVAHRGVVLSADGSTGGLSGDVPQGGAEVEWILSDTDIRQHPVGDLVAFAAEDGQRLWTGKSLQGFCNPGDVLVINGKVWCGADVSPRQALLDAAVDLRTGQTASHRPDTGMPVGGHTRCYRSKATERYLILGDVGVEFVDVGDWSWNASPWLRGTCQYGVMPCNGLLYVPPDSCACRPNMRLHGFAAMAAEPPAAPRRAAPAEPLERGPAYADGQHRTTAAPPPSADQWPTYRGDNTRSAWTTASVPPRLEPVWQTNIGGKLTSLTVAAGKVFLARVDSHTVHAIDAETGEFAWLYTAGGPVDSPPTIADGLAIFGCRDGWVYCLRANDGQLVWRFRAAREDRRLIAMEQLESTWPVNGSVLVREGKVWFAAGRSPFLDGGIEVYALAAATGEVVVKQGIFARGPQQFHLSAPAAAQDATPPGLPDILSASEDTVYMGWLGFDDHGKPVNVKPHLFSATGFLDDTWWHRTYWQYGTWMQGGFGGWSKAARQVPAGRMMAANNETLFCYARTKYDSGNGGNVHAGHVGLVKQDYQDMGRIDHPQNPYRLYATAKGDSGSVRRGKRVDAIRWESSVPVLVRAMVLADQILFVAGPEAGRDQRGLAQLPAPQPGLLCAVLADDGKPLAQHPLEVAPVLDGMAAAGQHLYLATLDGRVQCLGPSAL